MADFIELQENNENNCILKDINAKDEFISNDDFWKKTTEYEETLLAEADETEEIYDTKRIHTTNIVSITAYLLGVDERFFITNTDEGLLQHSIFEQLEENPDAKCIRILSRTRSVLMRSSSKIEPLMKFDLKNLNTLQEYFNPKDFIYLQENGIFLIKANYKILNYIIDINKYILDNISKCKSLYPLWVNWEYIKDLFIMKKGSAADKVKIEKSKFCQNLNNYPFQMYISVTPKDQGNILYNDKRFLEYIYAENGAMFMDYKKVYDASVNTKHNIYNFLAENENSIIIVDCENSDPYKLYATLKSLKQAEFNKVKKILLINDVNASSTWDILETFLNIPVQNVLVERIVETKSLVDMKLATEACKEHYVNNISSFILCSSDSDYYALIDSLPSANFLVLIEREKCSPKTKRALADADITFCSMDEFGVGDINDIKVKALTSQIKAYLDEYINVNINNAIEYAHRITRISMTDGEKKQFYDNYIKQMRISIDGDGNLSILLGKEY